MVVEGAEEEVVDGAELKPLPVGKAGVLVGMVRVDIFNEPLGRIRVPSGGKAPGDEAWGNEKDVVAIAGWVGWKETTGC